MTTPIRHMPAVNRRDFIERFLRARVENSTVVIPPRDEVVLTDPSSKVPKGLALDTAAKIKELGAAGMWGALPVVVSAAILRSVWQGESQPFIEQSRPPDDPELVSRQPKGAIEQEKLRQLDVIDDLDAAGGQHKVEFLLNGVDSPASASGNEVWLNLLASAQVFRSDELLAFAVAHEKGHINNGDTTWEPSATGLLWEVMVEAEDSALAEGDQKSAATLSEGIKALETSFQANAQLNELEADMEGLRILEESGFDRLPGLSFLYRTQGDAHHPPGPHRVEMLRRQLQGTERAISDQEMARIKDPGGS